MCPIARQIKPQRLGHWGSLTNPIRKGLVLHDYGLAATLAILDFKRNLFALLHFLLARTLQDRGVQENILPAIIRGHEAKATHLIEPLDRAIDGIGRPAFVTGSKFTARRRAITKGWTRRTESSRAATKAVGTTEIAACRAVAKTTTWRGTEPAGPTKVTAGRAIAKSTARRGTEATTEIATRRTFRPHITTWRTFCEPIIAEFATRRTVSTPRTELPLMNLGDEPTALAVSTNLANQLIAGFRGFDACFGQGRCMKEHVLTIRTQHEAEAFTAIVPLHLGLNRPGATLRIVVRKHCVSYP
jgi:hypothetical protein